MIDGANRRPNTAPRRCGPCYLAKATEIPCSERAKPRRLVRSRLPPPPFRLAATTASKSITARRNAGDCATYGAATIRPPTPPLPMPTRPPYPAVTLQRSGASGSSLSPCPAHTRISRRRTPRHPHTPPCVLIPGGEAPLSDKTLGGASVSTAGECVNGSAIARMDRQQSPPLRR